MVDLVVAVQPVVDLRAAGSMAVDLLGAGLLVAMAPLVKEARAREWGRGQSTQRWKGMMNRGVAASHGSHETVY